MNLFPQWTKPRLEWVTATAEQSISNQNGGDYYEALFRNWTREGWEIVSVTPIPNANSWAGFRLVGVLRREIRRA